MIDLFYFVSSALSRVWVFLHNIVVYPGVSYLSLIVAFAVLAIFIRLIPKPH
jgi:hypothetical protein